MPRTPKLVLREEERRRLLENPPKGAWIEKRVRDGRVYYYLRWREGKEKFTLSLTEEEVEEVKERLRERECVIPDIDQFMEMVRRKAEGGDEDAKYLLKRWKREKGIIGRVLKILAS